MLKSYFPYFRKVIVSFVFLIITSEWQVVNAVINGVHGINYSSSASVNCYANPPQLDSGAYFKGKACDIHVFGYVPVSGKYKVRLALTSANNEHADSSYGYFDSTKNLDSQTVNVTSSNVPISLVTSYMVHACYVLVDEAGKEWSLPVGDGRGCTGYTPVPPTPPAPTVSCVINNNGALSVDFGSIDRTSLPTVPGTGQIQSKQIPIVCTSASSTATATMSMKVNYTSITVSGAQVIKTSANGVGVSVLYNDQVLASGSVKNMVFNTGSNSLTLGFEAVRNPAVSIGDIPTGAFSASAVMVMTMQ
ncbi:fimbrial protein [Cronobacter dublinensis]|nr:fimbrial protein [Cronobacter dublinensis]